MADLTTLDATQPPDSESAGQGASRIRDTRDAILTSFAIEHALSGIHKFLSGNQAARPAAGNVNRIYINTTDNRIERDDGTSFKMLHAIAGYYTTDASTVAVGSTGALITSVVVDVIAGAFLFAIGIAEWTVVAADNGLNKQIYITDGGLAGAQVGGASAVCNDVFNITAGSEKHTQVVLAGTTTPSTGSRTIALIGKASGANPGSVGNKGLAVFVV